jgi:hypothetical protein
VQHLNEQLVQCCVCSASVVMIEHSLHDSSVDSVSIPVATAQPSSKGSVLITDAYYSASMTHYHHLYTGYGSISILKLTPTLHTHFHMKVLHMLDQQDMSASSSATTPLSLPHQLQ